jgi:hypothetical protein
MKLLFVILLFIPLLANAQPNSDAAKMKKDGTRQIFLFSNEKHPVPDAILYYDENGFFCRELALDWYPSDDPHFTYTLSAYDRQGRLIKSESGTYTGTDPAHLVFLRDNKYSVTWNYANDSVIIQTDSVFHGSRIDNITRKITITHWKKNNLPARKHRPVFLTDSFPEKEKITETVYHFYYQSEETSADDEPVKTDSSYSVMYVDYVVDSNYMTGNYKWERHNSDTIEQYESTRIYTLHQAYDTITWSNTSWINLPTAYEKINGLDNLHYITVQPVRIKRGFSGYTIYMYPNLYKGAHGAEGDMKPRKIKTKDPWHDSHLEVFYLEEFFPEDYSLYFFEKRYSPKKIVLVK